ncbi:MAG: enoyl-[acyl-carrier-protein] reductase FabV [Acidimicrobiaceae bacterium]|nr:enoyl-[acyl-carrier-protein] reductase FabV [Acidimicrobiaceae bacterium]
MRGFVALDAHPHGCRANIAELVRRVEPTGQKMGPVVIVGSSTGYGLASAVVAALGYGAPVVGVCLERPAERDRSASAGWYNSAALHDLAREREAVTVTLNADCFAPATKRRVASLLEERFGPAEALIYSVAAPVRVDSTTNTRHRSVIKPMGAPYRTKTLRLDRQEVAEVTLDPATSEEAEATTRVMGGEDWATWVSTLDDRGLLASSFRTVAFTYVGSALTAPIYRGGTIGRAKQDLEETALDLALRLGTKAWTSVNGAVVTQASAAIPGVPLYLSLLMAATRDLGWSRQDVVDQARRLFAEHLGPGCRPRVDGEGRIRLDDWELASELQTEVGRRWAMVTTDNLKELADVEGFRTEFRRLFGFDRPDVDYEVPVEVEVPLPET